MGHRLTAQCTLALGRLGGTEGCQVGSQRDLSRLQLNQGGAERSWAVAGGNGLAMAGVLAWERSYAAAYLAVPSAITPPIGVGDELEAASLSGLLGSRGNPWQGEFVL